MERIFWKHPFVLEIFSSHVFPLIWFLWNYVCLFKNTFSCCEVAWTCLPEMARSLDLRIHIVRCSQTVLFVWIHRFNQPFCPWLQSYGKEVVGWNLKISRILANFHEKLGWIGLGLGKLVGWLTFVKLPNAGGVSQCINQKNLCLCTPVLFPKSMESEVWMECEQVP